MRLYPKRGALVSEVRPGELDDVVAARVLIETDAVRRVTRDPQRAAELVLTLAEILEAQRAGYVQGDLSAVAEADASFHAAIVDAGGNTLLSGFFATLRDRQRRMVARSLWRRDERVEQVLADHELLCRLIAEGEPEPFEVALARHLRNTHRELLS